MQKSKTRNELKNNIAKLAKKEIVFFRLGQYKNVYFKDIHTYNQEQFNYFLHNKTSNVLIGI